MAGVGSISFCVRAVIGVAKLAVSAVTKSAPDFSGIPVDALDDLQGHGGDLHGFVSQATGGGSAEAVMKRGFGKLSAFLGEDSRPRDGIVVLLAPLLVLARPLRESVGNGFCSWIFRLIRHHSECLGRDGSNAESGTAGGEPFPRCPFTLAGGDGVGGSE